MNTPNMDDIQCLRADIKRAVSELFDAREEIKRLMNIIQIQQKQVERLMAERDSLILRLRKEAMKS